MGIRILFDLMDGYWYNRPETCFPLYHSADIVFKRSFSSVKNSEVFGAFSEKIHRWASTITCSVLAPL